jgi:hypothetical protein
MTYKQIGRKLGISHNTVHYHVRAAAKALGVASPTEVASLVAATAPARKVGPRFALPGPLEISFRSRTIRFLTMLGVAAYAVLATEYVGPAFIEWLGTLGI